MMTCQLSLSKYFFKFVASKSKSSPGKSWPFTMSWTVKKSFIFLDIFTLSIVSCLLSTKGSINPKKAVLFWIWLWPGESMFHILNLIANNFSSRNNSIMKFGKYNILNLVLSKYIYSHDYDFTFLYYDVIFEVCKL